MNVIAQMSNYMSGEREVEVPARPNLDENKKMHAVIWHGKNDVRYVDVPTPLITDSRDIILRVTASTICGSDLHMYSGGVTPMHDGDILGHEFMGTIEEVGSDVTNLQQGQRVVVSFPIACGTCDFCTRKEFTGCKTTNPSNLMKDKYGHRTAAIFGYSHLTGGVPGGQAEFVRVPYAEVNCLPVPEDLPDEKVLLLSDVVPTAFHGVETAEVKPGDKVAIWGLGPIGLMAAKLCTLRNAGLVVGIDRVKERLELAKSIGIQTINFSDEDVLKTLSDYAPDGFDVVIECAGFEASKTMLHKIEQTFMVETDTSDVFEEMFSALRPFGRCSVLGVYVGYANHFPVGAMMEKGITITSGQAPVQKYWKDCLEMIKSGELDPTFMFTHRRSLSDAPELYKKFSNREEGVIKVFLRPETSPNV